MQTKYTNSILTIIAACLVFQVVQSFRQKPIPVTVQTQEKSATPTGTLDVRIVGVSDPLRVNLVSVGGDTLSRVGGQTVLPVGVHNTVEVNVKGVDGGLAGPSYARGLPVWIMTR